MNLPKGWGTPLAAIGAVALWGLAFPLIQVGLEDFSPVMLGFIRFALASSVMMAVVLLKYRFAEVVSTLRREWKPMIALGVLYVTIPNIAQNLGLQGSNTSSIASVIQSSGPVMTLVFAVMLLREELTRNKAFGTVIAMAGTLMLVFSRDISLENEGFVSNLLILVSATSYGLAWVSAKRMLSRNPPVLIIGLSLVLGTLFLGAAVPMEPGSRAGFDAMSVLNLAVLGFLCAGVSSVLYLSSLEHEEVSKMAFFIYLMPLFASLFAWAILGQSVLFWTAVCGMTIVVGIAISNRPSRAKAATQAGAASSLPGPR